MAINDGATRISAELHNLFSIQSDDINSKYDCEVASYPTENSSAYLAELTTYHPTGATFLANKLLLAKADTTPIATPKSAQKITTDDGPKDRSEIPDELKWDMTDLYPTMKAWEKAYGDTLVQIKGLAALKETMTRSGDDLLKTLDSVYDAKKAAKRVYVYGHMVADQDKGDPKGLAMETKALSIMKDYSAASAFLDPMIQSLGTAKLAKFVAETPGLKAYSYILETIMAKLPHTLPAAQEEIIASYSQVSQHPMSVFETFNYGDMPFGKVTLSNGKEVEVTHSAYGKYRRSNNRDDRVKIFEAFWGNFKKFGNTYASLLSGQVMGNVTTAKLHKYDGPLAAALDATNLDPKVYDAMIDGVHSALPALHRYLRLRKKLMGVDELRYHDMYPPMIAGAEMKYSILEGKAAILRACQPLGKEYVADLNNAMNSDWTDYMPNKGKRGGAYMEPDAFDVHPYVLLNWDGGYDSVSTGGYDSVSTGGYGSVSTIAHEFGHAMHSIWTAKKQPYHYSDYSMFIAEIPSTFNEILLARQTLAETTDNGKKLAILGQMLEGMRTTVFRQAQFAEFEKKIYDMAWKGESLTAETLNKAYGDILKQYYGHNEGVMTIDDIYTAEWSYVPHFYYNFYVYNYTTSFVAATSLANSVMSGEPGAKERYLDMLSKGSSNDPVTLLKEGGVDMTTTKPYEVVRDEMNRIMDQIEAILKEEEANAAK